MADSFEQYTPEFYVDLAREVMGRIDLDPFSSDLANVTVRADRWYTKEDNGFDQMWDGRVWMNPPCTRGLIGESICKLAGSVRAGQVSEYITLTINATHSKWCQSLLTLSSLVCLPDRRISFIQPDTLEAKRGNDRAHIFCYYGPNQNKFREVFSQIGVVK